MEYKFSSAVITDAYIYRRIEMLRYINLNYLSKMCW